MKCPDPTDVHVGRRIRMGRVMLHMSQAALGERVGVTFQQVQKYEKGMNRVGSSRLLEICVALEVPVSFMFEGLPGAGGPAVLPGAADSVLPPWLVDFLDTADGRRIAISLGRITDMSIRHHVAALVESVANTVYGQS